MAPASCLSGHSENLSHLSSWGTSKGGRMSHQDLRAEEPEVSGLRQEQGCLSLWNRCYRFVHWLHTLRLPHVAYTTRAHTHAHAHVCRAAAGCRFARTSRARCHAARYLAHLRQRHPYLHSVACLPRALPPRAHHRTAGALDARLRCMPPAFLAARCYTTAAHTRARATAHARTGSAGDAHTCTAHRATAAPPRAARTGAPRRCLYAALPLRAQRACRLTVPHARAIPAGVCCRCLCLLPPDASLPCLHAPAYARLLLPLRAFCAHRTLRATPPLYCRATYYYPLPATFHYNWLVCCDTAQTTSARRAAFARGNGWFATAACLPTAPITYEPHCRRARFTYCTCALRTRRSSRRYLYLNCYTPAHGSVLRMRLPLACLYLQRAGLWTLPRMRARALRLTAYQRTRAAANIPSLRW